MWSRKKSTVMSIILCLIVAGILIALLFTLPKFFNFYFKDYHGLTDSHSLSILRSTVYWCFYPSVFLALTALYALIKLLLNIKDDNTFIKDNVKYLRTISWCCYGASIITLVGSYFYLPLLFIAAACGFLATVLRVVKNVMQSAVELREENDLTI